MAREQPPSFGDTVRELWELLRTYGKQETVGPLKGLGRYLGFGVGGSLLLALGVVMVGLGGLRLLQEEADTVFDGNWSFAPYLIVGVFGIVVIGLATFRITREPKRRV